MIGVGLVTLVVPAKDEGGAIAATLRSLPRSTLHAAGYRTEVIVLDGHSRDETVTIARSLGAAVLPDRGHGKGSALREARSAFQGDYVIMLDGDGTYATDAIPRVLALLASGEADVVMGDRVALDGSMSVVHRAGNALLSLGATVLYGHRVPDLCTGLWGFRTDALRRLPLISEGFELEAELFALSARLHLRIRHTPVDYLPRTGDSKLATRDGLRIGWSLVRNRFSALHRRIVPASPSRGGDLLPQVVPWQAS
ncbi:MAG: glycosyltransferase [Candidatus Thermoplasmatota archaeon]|jgi:dolichol-phosphate mannosyltransferase